MEEKNHFYLSNKNENKIKQIEKKQEKYEKQKQDKH